MFLSIVTKAAGLFISICTVLAIPHGDPVINTATGLVGVAGILGGCAGMYWHGSE